MGKVVGLHRFALHESRKKTAADRKRVAAKLVWKREGWGGGVSNPPLRGGGGGPRSPARPYLSSGKIGGVWAPSLTSLVTAPTPPPSLALAPLL